MQRITGAAIGIRFGLVSLGLAKHSYDAVCQNWLNRLAKAAGQSLRMAVHWHWRWHWRMMPHVRLDTMGSEAAEQCTVVHAAWQPHVGRAHFAHLAAR
jgi:hypothetical protein